MYQNFKPWIFKLDAEFAHEWALKGLPLISALKSNPKANESLQIEVAGLHFDNPVGLAAGFDKSAQFYPYLPKFGFGFVEVGTLTPRPQPGNAKPRLFRIPESEALLNRMGFNNDGAEIAAKRIQKQSATVPLGINIGKNKTTPNQNALDDYLKAFQLLSPLADYMVVNVSSPNTPGLRDLQDGPFLTDLALALKESDPATPLFLKIAPDLESEALDSIPQVLFDGGYNGLIATNTTLDKSSVGENWREEAGGLSGAPLTQKADEVLKRLSQSIQGQVALIGVGGVMNARDLIRKIELGADLVQVYSGWIYGGPSWIQSLLKGLAQELQDRNCSLSELKGSALRN